MTTIISATCSALLLVAAALPVAPASADPLAPWQPFWSREGGTGQAIVDTAVTHDGRPTIRIEHKGRQDWSLNRADRMAVEAGDIIELACRAKVQGEGDVILCAATYDKAGKVCDWMCGEQTARAGDWQPLRSRFVVPAGITQILPRVIGNGPATVWLDGFSSAKAGKVQALRDANLPAELTIANKTLAVTLHTADATFAVLDKRTQKTWSQKPYRPGLVITSAKAAADRIEFEWLLAAAGLKGRAVAALDGDQPELTVSLTADGDLKRSLPFPHPFVAAPPAYLVVPMNEGIAYPVDDDSIKPMHLIAYGGHGICMAFFGATDGAAGQMAILETPDDASIYIERVEGRLCITPAWDPQKGRWGCERRLRYVFFDAGGHVAIAKRYRAYARKTGLLKTLAEKRRENPNVDLLIGAVNVWYWARDALAMVREMRAAGIERILWSHGAPPETLRAMNDMPGVLTSRYDIYQDAMNPANYPLLRGVHGDWTGAAWPKDLAVGPGGDWLRGWQVEAKDGSMIPCGVLCDRQAPAYAEKRIGEELKTSPYRCRFIDTTTASSWRECYSPDHPMTRSDSRRFKMDLLGLVSGKFKLVTGSETGHDASVPYVHYFEGMLSLGPYRVHDAGRRMQQIVDEVPEQVARFQVGQAYRLPLWELVYHDCVVAQWYWGDYNNKLPATWDKRDLFNALYGTPPMFMFDRALWGKNKDRFVASYKAASSVARATGYSEMTDHRFLTPDRNVQQTVFAGGVTVTANFSDAPFRLPDGTEVAPKGCHVAGMKP